ncbi:MAG: energy transducer TonB [Thermodesulfobacteriota bacterium]
MSEGNILLGGLLVLFSAMLIAAVAMAPDPGPRDLEAIEVDMGSDSLQSSRNIPRPRPRPKNIKPVQEKRIDPFDRARKVSRADRVDKSAPDAPSLPSLQGMGAVSAPASPGDAAVSATDAAAGFMGRADYLELLKMRVGAFRKYPPEAKSRGVQGRVRVRFQVDRAGKVMGVAVIDGSGSRELDRAAVKAVKNASPFPRAPSDMFSYPLTLQVEVSFELT